uniref:PABS domain-containing protein n=1 Tax=Calcidiscus leptoporus TaxID=127549 RepID=A0A7S0NU41_9EUKA
MQWVSEQAERGAEASERYDAVFVDIFDGTNETPAPFRDAPFLQDVHRLLRGDGVVLMNLHTGEPRLDGQCASAKAAFREAFHCGCYALPVRYQGNTVLAATARPLFGSKEALAREARANAVELGVCTFDPAPRLDRLAPL